MKIEIRTGEWVEVVMVRKKYYEYKVVYSLFNSDTRTQFKDGITAHVMGDDERICEACGAIYSNEYNDSEDEVGECLCDECYDENFPRCDECGERFCADDLTWVSDEGACFCQDCIENYFVWCNGYEEYFRARNMSFYEVNGEMYSERYCDSYFEWCEDCQEYHDGDCPNACKCVGGYHAHKHGFEKFGRGDDTIGIELEVLSMNEKRNGGAEKVLEIGKGRLVLEEDSSIGERGFEIISHIHTLNEWENFPLEEVCDELTERGYRSHDTNCCGLHVHISRTFFGATEYEQKQNIAKLTYMYYHHGDFFGKLARRGFGGYCEKDYDCNTPTNAYRGVNKGDRYRAINMRNIDTIEYRHARGTLKANTIRAWVDVCVLLAKNSRKIKEGDTDLYKWFEGANDRVVNYVREKARIDIEKGVKLCA